MVQWTIDVHIDIGPHISMFLRIQLETNIVSKTMSSGLACEEVGGGLWNADGTYCVFLYNLAFAMTYRQYHAKGASKQTNSTPPNLPNQFHSTKFASGRHQEGHCPDNWGGARMARVRPKHSINVDYVVQIMV